MDSYDSIYCICITLLHSRSLPVDQTTLKTGSDSFQKEINIMITSDCRTHSTGFEIKLQSFRNIFPESLKGSF
jgi:hypothetical protein